MTTFIGPLPSSSTSVRLTTTGRAVLSHQTPCANIHLISRGAGVNPAAVCNIAQALEIATQHCRWVVCKPITLGQPASPIDPTTGQDVDPYDDCHSRCFLTDAIVAAQLLGRSTIGYFTLGDDFHVQPLLPWLDRPVTGKPRFGLIPFEIIKTTPSPPVGPQATH